MAKVTKQTLEVKITDIGGHEFTATDTDEVKAGSLAFNLFMAGDVVEIKGENDTTYVPYHAIDHVVVTRTSSEEEITDDTCVPDEEIEP